MDECDGDITSQVQVEGAVNTQQAGDYTITYRVTDASGNVAEAKRNVTVKKPIPATGDKVIYLTFDDGPHASLTPMALDILNRHGAKGTFFMLGSNAVRNQSVVARAAAEGHEEKGSI